MKRTRKLATTDRSCISICLRSFRPGLGASLSLWKFSCHLIWSSCKIWLLYVIPCWHI